MKKILTFFLVTGFFLLTFSAVRKHAAAQTPITVSLTPQTASPSAGNSQSTLNTLRTKADAEIDRRTLALTNLITKLGTLKKVTPDQRTTFTTNIQTEITNLKTLRTKIDADTDVTTLKTDVGSIITSYRVFALYLPQVSMLAASDKVLNIIDTITPITGKLQTRIQQKQTAGQSVASMQATLTDLQTKLTDASTQANSVITNITPLAPTGYPGNKPALQNARAMLQTAFQDLKTVSSDAKTIIQALKSPAAGNLNTASPTTMVSH